MNQIYRIYIVFLLASAPALAAAPDRFYELRHEMAKSIKRQLDPEIKHFLARVEGPESSKLFDSRVMVILGTDLKLSGDATVNEQPKGFIAAVTVYVRLNFTTANPVLDMQIKDFISHALWNGALNSRPGLSLTQTPNLRVKVFYNPPITGVFTEVRRDFILIILALCCLLAMLIPRWLNVRNKNKIKTKIRIEPQTDPKLLHVAVDLAIPVEVEKPVLVPPPMPQEISKRPTESYTQIYNALLASQVDPSRGSWYLHALPEVATSQLQNAFETMPFEEAMMMLRAVNRRYRGDVVRRLDLHPALKSRIMQESADQNLEHEMKPTSASAKTTRPLPPRRGVSDINPQI